MKVVFKYFIIFIVILVILFGLFKIFHSKTYAKNEFSVLLVYNPNLKAYYYVLDGYKSVLEEEGVLYQTISVFDLLTLNPKNLVSSKWAIIFPDGVNQYIPKETEMWVKNYLNLGGNVFIAYDVGIKSIDGGYLDESLFSNLVSLNYITYKKDKDSCFTTGYLMIKDKAKQDFLEIPDWKILKGYLLGGYSYGKYEYPVARAEKKDSLRESEIFASVVSSDNREYPGIVVKDYDKGKIMYVNLPLGYLKTYADDFPLRTFLRVFLFKMSKIPHLLNVPYGVGGIVVNWHVDSSIDWKSIPYMIENNYLRKGIEYSIDITAGDFRDTPNDNLGFDACGKGKKFVYELAKFGSIGSHGGWAHNYFSNNINNGTFKEDEIYYYIKKNSECLESITNKKVLEYAAPNGVHPQPVTTEVLEKLGVIAYYYTGDNGSSPNRTFVSGAMVSDKVIAFPISSLGKYASLYEMYLGGVDENTVKNFLFSVADFVEKNKTIRLIYSHPYDIPLYPNALKEFLDFVENLQSKNLIEIKPMSYFAEFILRLLKTKYTISFDKKEITIENEEGLNGITLAIPKKFLFRDKIEGIKFQDYEDYQLLIFTDSFKDTKITIPFVIESQTH